MKGFHSASEPILIDCGSKYSFFFDLIEPTWIGFNNSPLHRICTLMRKMGVKSYVKEELPIIGELADEVTAAKRRVDNRGVQGTASRLTFFRKYPKKGDWWELTEVDILGYAVIMKLVLGNSETRNYILESVIRLPAIPGPAELEMVSVPNYYVHCCRDFITSVGTEARYKNFTLLGSFFCQQNNLTHVCAHAALRMAYNSCLLGPKLSNLKINSILEIDHKKVKIGRYGVNRDVSIGLNEKQIKSVVEALDLECHLADFNSNPAEDYHSFTYPIIESGYPVILGIKSQKVDHVVTVLGHTLNTDRWSPEAEHGYGGWPTTPHISAASWVDHFILGDDNFGTYVTVSTESIRNFLVPKYNPQLHASLAIGLLPKNINVKGDVADRLALLRAIKLIKSVTPSLDNRWLHLLQNAIKDGTERKSRHWIVSRTLLREKQDYCEDMHCEDEKGNNLNESEFELLEKLLPDNFWVTELTIPNLYTGNKRKLGDIITKCFMTKEEWYDKELEVLAWLPGVLFTGKDLGESHNWSFFGHVPLIRTACQDWVTRIEW